jgi:hypothetical protein
MPCYLSGRISPKSSARNRRPFKETHSKAGNSLRSESVGAWRSGSAPALGAGGRWFESSRPDHRLRSTKGSLLRKDFCWTRKTTTYLWSPYCLAQRRLAQRLRGLELSDHIGADSTCGRSADLDRYLPGDCRTRTVRFGGGTTGLGCRERGLTPAGGDERPAHAPVAVRRSRELLDDVGVR